MKTVFITGASGGIGKSAVELFHRNGWNVAATIRSHNQIKDFDNLTNVKCYQLDVTNIDSVKSGLDAAIQDFGDIDVLVNCAGMYITSPLETATDDEIRSIIETNIIGVINMMRVFIPYYRSRQGGTIIDLSSVCGKITFPFQSLYNCTKFAVEGLSESLAHELSLLNIKIKIIEPGMTKTNLYKAVMKHSQEKLPDEYKNSFTSWLEVLHKIIDGGNEPETIAKTIYKAASDNRNKLRYIPDIYAKTFLLFKALLPFPIFTYIIRKMSKM